MRRILCAGSLVLLAGVVSAQSSATALRFEIADVHASSQTAARFARLVPVRNGRYEIRAATMVDLIRFAWNCEADRILGGPNWLELDRFDVIAKVPPDSPPDAQRSMLQSLLKDRFQLALHEQTKPVATWVLSAGKKPQPKEADGSGETGCKLRNESGPPPEGGSRITVNGAAINLGAGATIQYACRNMTMAAFAEGLRTMMFSLIPTPVLNRTGLQGIWNFDVRWSLPFLGPMAGSGERITVVDALEKQLGLKLEQTPVSQAVLVVDSVNRQPSDNPVGIADALPVIPPPTEFEVADVKLVSPDYHGVMRFQMLPSGRFLANGMPVRFLINRAFNTNNNDQIAGLPGWVDTVRVDITAKAPEESAALSYDPDVLAPMLRRLLMERFGLAYHTEQRPVSAYSLVAAKPKMTMADPQSPHLLQDSASFSQQRPGLPSAELPERHDGAAGGKSAKPSAGADGAGAGCHGFGGRLGFHFDLQPCPARHAESNRGGRRPGTRRPRRLRSGGRIHNFRIDRKAARSQTRSAEANSARDCDRWSATKADGQLGSRIPFTNYFSGISNGLAGLKNVFRASSATVKSERGWRFTARPRRVFFLRRKRCIAVILNSL